MPQNDSTHEAADKTRKGEPLEPVSSAIPPKEAETAKTPEIGEGAQRQIKPDGR